MNGPGGYGEQLARAFLVREGFRILEMNYRFHHGEIDIIAEEGDVLVFCEVKTRTNDRYGAPELAVTALKQRQIRKIALGYITVRGLHDRVCRFDVVAIRLYAGEPEIRLLRDAFR
ncbi:MAG: YraN family protein [Ignavibacteriae bacterium]|nr:YraN family protein [Ignavibacteriota bacterium]